VRYRFDFGADSALQYDLIIEGGKDRMERAADSQADVTLYCDRTTFALLLFDRFRLDSALAHGRVTIAGDESLARVLGQHLRPYV
jgi:putative sterol carrier protein